MDLEGILAKQYKWLENSEGAGSLYNKNACTNRVIFKFILEQGVLLGDARAEAV